MPLYAAVPSWRIIFGLSYAAWALFEMWVWSRDRRKVAGARKDKGSLYALIFLLVLGVFTAFMAPYHLPFGRIHLPGLPVFVLAIVLIWAGIAFRLWAILTLGRFFRYTVTVQDDHRLITSGPYRRLRHPSYTGALLTLMGIGLAQGNWVSLMSVIVFSLLAYGWRIRVEEQALAERFSQDFFQQRARSWAVLPFIW